MTQEDADSLLELIKGIRAALPRYERMTQGQKELDVKLQAVQIAIRKKWWQKVA